MNKDTHIIPNGPYCYDENGVCPYWSQIPDAPEQMNGYCAFLGKSDEELRQERPYFNTKDPSQPPLYISLLWDQVKECWINYDN